MKQVTRDVYLAIKNGNPGLKPIASFSDHDGILPYGYGVPAMDTDWGIDDLVYCRHEMRKYNNPNGDWEHRYFINEALLNKTA